MPILTQSKNVAFCRYQSYGAAGLYSALCLLAVLIPMPAWAETWEDFQKVKAADEKSEVVCKGDAFAISKDVIVTRLTGPEALTQEPSVAFSSDLIFFDPGSWTIKERSRGQFDGDGSRDSHRSFAGIPIGVVEGHTCSIR